MRCASWRHDAPADASFSVSGYAPGMPEDPSTPRRLSLSRVLTVRSLLIAQGIASSRIYPKALGASAPDLAQGPADRADLVATAAGPGQHDGGSAGGDRRSPASASPTSPRRAPPRLLRQPPRRPQQRDLNHDAPAAISVSDAGLPGRRVVVVVLLSGALITAFDNNPLLNSLILLVLRSGHRLEHPPGDAAVAGGDLAGDLPAAPAPGLAALPSPKLLAPMASMLATRTARGATGSERFTLSAPAMRCCWTASPAGWTKAASCRAT